MIDLNPGVTAILMLVGLLVVVLTGYPLAIGIGALTLLVGFSSFGTGVMRLVYDRTFSLLLNYVILAVPLFIFMGDVLERTGIAEKLYDALYVWLGNIKGGLAIMTVLIGTILAACVGLIGASVTMLSLVGLPAMIKRGYSKSLACGAVCAGGTLGIFIPPSIMLVIYGPMAQISVGKLFFGAFLPGILLSFLYITYIAIRCLLEPNIGPTAPVTEGTAIPLSKKLSLLTKSMLPPVILVLAVLGTIYFGVAPPTEAAAVGAFATVLLSIAYRKFSWSAIKDVSLMTMKISSFILLIAAASFAFTGVFLGAGSGDAVKELVLGAPGGKWGIFSIVMVIIFILGFFVDWLGIVFIMVPIVTPIAASLGFDTLWFAIMVCLNLQTSFMTPPFAAALFYVRGTAPPELNVTTNDIISGMLPFVFLILVALGLCVAFPQIILWLPKTMIG